MQGSQVIIQGACEGALPECLFFDRLALENVPPFENLIQEDVHALWASNLTSLFVKD